jgi:O-methyltransferase
MFNYIRSKIYNKLLTIYNYGKYARFKNIYKKYKEFTMIPEQAYVDNLLLSERISDLEGSVIECGVWRGGMTAGIADLLGESRHYYLFDSFEGLPEAKKIDGQSAIAWQSNVNGENYNDNCCAPEEYAQNAMKFSLAENYTLKKGWFEETLPTFNSSEKIALLRLDADWYSSTQLCLTFLFDLVVENGLIIIDDYYAWDGCSKAVHDYLSKNSRPERIESFNGICFIRKRSND